MYGTLLKILTALALFVCLLVPAFAQTAVDPHYYDYDADAPFSVTEAPYPAQATIGITVTRVTYPSPVVTATPVNNTVVGYLFMPQTPGAHPAMVVEHEFIMCRAIARANIAAFLIVQPYTLERRPLVHSPDAEILSGKLPVMVSALRQTCLDARRAADWLQKRPDIDPNRLGIAGISLGGVMAPVIAGVDRRFKVVMTFVGGADIEDILWNGPLTTGLHDSLIKFGYTYQDLRVALAPMESKRWLQGFDPKNALLFNGRYDVVIDPNQAEDSAKALGGAKMVWTNTGHYGLVLVEKDAEAVGTKFLRSRFFADAPPFHAPDTIPSRTIKIGVLYGGREGFSPLAAYQLLNFNRAGRLSLDGQLTFHGFSLGLSARTGINTSVGLELPLFHGGIKPRPFFSMNVTL